MQSYAIHLSKRRFRTIALPSFRAKVRHVGSCQGEGDVQKPDCSGCSQNSNAHCKLPGTAPGTSYGLDFPGKEEFLSDLGQDSLPKTQ